MSTEKKLYEISDVIEKNGGPIPMSAAGIYKACNEGKIPCVRISRRFFIPSWYIDELTKKPGD